MKAIRHPRTVLAGTARRLGLSLLVQGMTLNQKEQVKSASKSVQEVRGETRLLNPRLSEGASELCSSALWRVKLLQVFLMWRLRVHANLGTVFGQTAVAVGSLLVVFT